MSPNNKHYLMNAGAASRLSLEPVNGINPRRRHVAVPSKICQYPRIRTQVGLCTRVQSILWDQAEVTPVHHEFISQL
jgi:hypothetical protein